ncbi:Fc.00g114250.m01.CDS01 [Cosmosporella sp. VM-42]
MIPRAGSILGIRNEAPEIQTAQDSSAQDFAAQENDEAPIPSPTPSGDGRELSQEKSSVNFDSPRASYTASSENLEERLGDVQPTKSRNSVRSAAPSVTGTEVNITPIQSVNGLRLSPQASRTRRSDAGDTASWNSAAGHEDMDNLLTWAIDHHRGRGILRSIKQKQPNALIQYLSPHNKRRKNSVSRADSESQVRGEWKRPHEGKSFRVSFAEMQRMRLRKLQCKLVEHAVQIDQHGKEPDHWESDLQDYVKAIQDYDYMIQQSQSSRDPFLVTGERMIDDFVIRTTLGRLQDQEFGETITVPGPWEQDSQPIWGTRSTTVFQTWAQGFKERILMATVGGFFLIGPMWLMVLRNSLYTSLISTTVLVAAFGFLMACFVEKPKEVMSGTAAYAAVLVVFVGLNNPSP